MRVARSAPAILHVLRDVAPTEATQFESEFRDALQQAAARLDLAPAERVLDRWWGIAHLRLNPPTAEERDLAHRLQAGEEVGWPSPEERLTARSR